MGKILGKTIISVERDGTSVGRRLLYLNERGMGVHDEADAVGSVWDLSCR